MNRDDFKTLLVHNATDPNVFAPPSSTRQLHTAALSAERLDRNGGVILGDEVGAGKTFVTFAVLTETLLRQPSAAPRLRSY